MYTVLLLLGVFLWVDAHWFRRLIPSLREAMDERFGKGPARGMIAGAIFLSIVLMVIGYRGSDITPVYTPFSGAGHLNNLALLRFVE